MKPKTQFSAERNCLQKFKLRKEPKVTSTHVLLYDKELENIDTISQGKLNAFELFLTQEIIAWNQ